MSPDVVRDAATVVGSLLRDVPDFPQPGIVFKDLTPVLADPRGLALTGAALAAPWVDRGITAVAGIEARGFLLAPLVAQHLGTGVVLLRKPGKLPADTRRIEYDLEYGTDALEVHRDAVGPGDRVLLVDDVLATGGTASAGAALLEQCGADVPGAAFVIELGFLGGRSLLDGLDVTAVLAF